MSIYHSDDIPEDLLQYFQPAPELGLEETVEEFIEKMTAVFEEVRRVLRDDGTLWLNMGDCYASGHAECAAVSEEDRPNTRKPGARGGRRPKDWKGRAPTGEHTGKGVYRNRTGFNVTGRGLKPKDLVGQPWMLAFALRSAGWYLRSEIIWQKPNPMPESCRDRPTKSHEQIFLLSKKPRYFYDQVAVQEPATHAGKTVKLGPKSLSKGQAAGRGVKASGNGNADSVLVGDKRNLRDVWKMATQSFPEAHFATFPEELPRKCILAGTSEKGCCPECGAPVVRVVEKTRTFESGSGKSGNAPSGKNGPSLQGGGETGDIRRGPVVHSETTGWQPGCKCGSAPVPCIVLDPFGGAGTTALVASKMGRNAILTELSPKYANMAADRIQRECGLLAAVTVDEREEVKA